MNPTRTLTTALAAAALTLGALATASAPAAAGPDTTDRGFVECDSYFPTQVPCVRDTRHWFYDANGYAPSLIVRRNNDGVLVSRKVTHARAHRLLHGTDPAPEPAAPDDVLSPRYSLSAGAEAPTTVTTARARKCKTVTNQYAPYDQFTVYNAGPRYAGKTTWRTAIIGSYRSCPRKAVFTRIGVEVRRISGDGSSTCGSIRTFKANLTMNGYNPGPATTPCVNGDTSRFITWYPASPVTIRRSLPKEFQDVSGTWDVDVRNRRDVHGSYSRLYPRFNR